MSKRTDSPGLGSLAGAALTALSTLVRHGFAAVIGVVIAREFGRSDETDGFFAAYGVFIVVVLAVAVDSDRRAPVAGPLARGAEARRARSPASRSPSRSSAVPLVLLAFELASEPIARLLTGDGSDVATDACAEALRWMVPAAVAHLFAGLAASGLAALDDYATAALGYATGSAAGLALILTRVDQDGLVAVSRGMAAERPSWLFSSPRRCSPGELGAPACRPAPCVLRGSRSRHGSGSSPPRRRSRSRFSSLYVVCLPFAGRLGSGAVTSFGYAYLAAASLVSVTAFSIGLVSSVPLTRAGLGSGASGASRRVARRGSRSRSSARRSARSRSPEAGSSRRVLGDAYGGDIGAEVARLVVLLSAWMVASVGVNVAFPLAFVAERLRALPWIGRAALVLQVVLAWIASELFELDGLALALALSTFLVLAALLARAGRARPRACAASRPRRSSSAALTLACVRASRPPPRAGSRSALVGLALYCALVALVRPARAQVVVGVPAGASLAAAR